jgi:hypothetical protein
MRWTDMFSASVAVELTRGIFGHGRVRVLNNENSLCSKIMASGYAGLLAPGQFLSS